MRILCFFYIIGKSSRFCYDTKYYAQPADWKMLLYSLMARGYKEVSLGKKVFFVSLLWLRGCAKHFFVLRAGACLRDPRGAAGSIKASGSGGGIWASGNHNFLPGTSCAGHRAGAFSSRPRFRKKMAQKQGYKQ